MIDELDIILPDDFHHHFRDNGFLNDTVHHAMQRFGRCIAMPNTVPPIKTAKDANEYFYRIINSYVRNKINRPKKNNNSFLPLMILYLTDNTSEQDIIDAYYSGVRGCKLYPAGATTNSDSGVTNIKNIFGVLEKMSELEMILLVHCEVTDKKYDIFDREKYGIELIMVPIIERVPNLKIVMEHITTKEGVEFVKKCGPNIAATITAHHLLYNRNDLLVGGIKPHLYCLPILKTDSDKNSLLEAATSGNPKFFLGTDSVPHIIENKESSCGCAGVFTGHAAIELYAEAFDKVNKLHMLEGFSSIYGAKFYNLPLNKDRIKLRKSEKGILIPEKYKLGEHYVKPLRSNEYIKWYIEGIDYN